MYYILGAGVSGRAAAKYIQNKRQPSDLITLIDQRVKVSEIEAQLDIKKINLISKISPEDILDSDVLIPSPGISPDNDVYQMFAAKKCRIISEIDLALED
jgi:UDP-N-acetylmuramoylalanine-D-glutamate ligase